VAEPKPRSTHTIRAGVHARTGLRRATPAIEPDETTHASRALRIIGSLVAPTTVATALLLYFGRQHAYWFFDYFGVNFTIMGLSLQDYLIRSADGLFIPVTMMLTLFLLGSWAYQFLQARIPQRWWPLIVKVAIRGALVMGLVLSALAIVAAFAPTAFYDFPGMPGVSLALGVILLVAISRRAGKPAGARNVLEWAAAFLLVSVGLFWSVTDYAGSVGVRRGMDVQAALPGLPNTLVYSKDSLNLRVDGVRQVQCKDPNAAYGFRYDGLKLIVAIGNQYLLLPVTWTPQKGIAVVIPRTDNLRLEFTAPDTRPNPTC
jgi:hypothetical protein